MEKFDLGRGLVRKFVAPVALALGSFSVVGCGTEFIKEKPVRRVNSTGMTADEFAEQNNGKVAWLPGHGRPQDVRNTGDFCLELDGVVREVNGSKVTCEIEGVQSVIETDWNETRFDEIIGDFCEYVVGGAVIFVEKEKDSKQGPVFACFKPNEQ